MSGLSFEAFPSAPLLPSFTEWTGAAEFYYFRQRDACEGWPVTCIEMYGALYFLEACSAIPLPSLPFDPIYLGV